jgi:hypothetical protein
MNEAALPPPGTLDDLRTDAAAAGWRTTERALREWNRLGLLGSPTRRSLGRGHGQAPGLYSPQQRALFRKLATLHTQHARNEGLAKVVVWSWLDLDDAWVSTEQAIAAITTAIGNPLKSRRLANQAARQLVADLPMSAGPRAARQRLTRELAEQLYMGRIDAAALAPAVSAVLDAGPATVVRGPAGARLGTESVLGWLAGRAEGLARFENVTVEDMNEVRLHHRITRAQYRFARPHLRAAASEDTRYLFDESTRPQLIDSAVPIILYLLGVLPRYRTRTGVPR